MDYLDANTRLTRGDRNGRFGVILGNAVLSRYTHCAGIRAGQYIEKGVKQWKNFSHGKRRQACCTSVLKRWMPPGKTVNSRISSIRRMAACTSLNRCCRSIWRGPYTGHDRLRPGTPIGIRGINRDTKESARQLFGCLVLIFLENTRKIEYTLHKNKSAIWRNAYERHQMAIL